MNELKVPVPPSLSGHTYDAFHSEGLIYALNCMPLSSKAGLYLWRPMAHPDYQAKMFNPDVGDVFFDSTCAQNRIHVLYKDGATGKSKVSWWDGQNQGVLPWDYPSADIGQITMFGTGMALALEGKGIFFVEWDPSINDWGDTYRLGALLWTTGQSANAVQVQTTSAQDLVTISWTDPELAGFKSWVSRVVIFVALPSEGLPDFEWTIEIVDGQGAVFRALETYRRDSALPPLPGAPRIWTPLTFTFLDKMELPITVRVVAVSGQVDLVFEGASTSYDGVGAGHNWIVGAIHMSVGGTMCPDGKVVAGYRGSLFGSYKSIFLQIAPAIDLEFQEEVNLESPIQRVLSYMEGIYVFCYNKTLMLTGWTARGVDLREVLAVGIPDQYAVGKSSHGIYMHFFGRIYVLGGGVSRIDTPFIAGAQAMVNVSAIDLLDFVLVSVRDRNVCLAFEPKTQGYVFWRFDELGDPAPRPLQGCRGALIFENGLAVLLTTQQFSPSYETVVTVSSGLLDKATQFCVQALEFRGQLSAADQTEVRIVAFGDDTASAVSMNVPTPVGTSSAALSAFGTQGLEWLVPELGSGTVVPNLGFPIFQPSPVTGDGSGGAEASEAFVTGKKFIVELAIGANNARSHADALWEWRLYGEPVGQGILGRV